MSYKRRKRKENQKSYALPILLAIVATWLAMAIFAHKSPTEVVHDLYRWVIGKEDAHPTKKDLKEVISKKTLTIDSLNTELTKLKEANPYRIAIVKTSANALNLRSEPNLTSEVVIQIPDSSAVKILYFDEEVLVLDGEVGKWCKIKYADKEGWVWGNYLEIQDEE